MKLSEIRALPLLPREQMVEIIKWMDNEQILLLVGARQVGKTSLLYLLIQHLLSQGIDESRLFYFDLEDFEILNLINSGVPNFMEYLRREGADFNKKFYLFIDEIQYLDNPTHILKLIADHYRNIKLVVSGSSTLQIRKKFKDSLVGRKILFEIYPLSFSEFLFFRKKKNLQGVVKDLRLREWMANPRAKEFRVLEIYQRELAQSYEEYVLYGGYPAVVLESNFSKKSVLISEIYQTYVRKDIGQLFTIEDINAFNNLIRLLALQIGSLVNCQELATALRISRLTVERYLFMLENTFIIKRVSPFFSNKRKEIVKMPKYFFLDLGLRNQIIRNFEKLEMRSDAGFLIENAIFISLNNHLKVLEELKFWRTKSGNEVDFVVDTQKRWAVEVKYQERERPLIPRGIYYFRDRYQPAGMVVITKNLLDRVEQGGRWILFVPAWLMG